MASDTDSRIKLKGADWFWYMSPTIWLATLAVVDGWLAVNAYLGHTPRADLTLWLSMSGLFGMLAAGAQWKLRRDLRFRRLETKLTSEQSYARVLGMIEARRWRLGEHERAVFLVYYTRASWFSWGERVLVRFRPNEVSISSICDPAKWPAVFGRHERNMADIRRAVI